MLKLLPRMVLCGLAVLAPVGCARPWNTQFPTPYTAPPAVENRRYERFDPFARQDLGPDTFTRPPGYVEPRSAPRQSKEAGINQGPQIPGVPNPSTAPAPSIPTQRYPGVVPF